MGYDKTKNHRVVRTRATNQTMTKLPITLSTKPLFPVTGWNTRQYRTTSESCAEAMEIVYVCSAIRVSFGLRTLASLVVMGIS